MLYDEKHTFFSICISLYNTSGLSKGTLHYRNLVIVWQHKQDISPALRKEILDKTTGISGLAGP